MDLLAWCFSKALCFRRRWRRRSPRLLLFPRVVFMVSRMLAGRGIRRAAVSAWLTSTFYVVFRVSCIFIQLFWRSRSLCERCVDWMAYLTDLHRSYNGFFFLFVTQRPVQIRMRFVRLVKVARSS